MVVLHVKREQQSLFLYEVRLDDLLQGVLRQIVNVHNGRLKVLRICDEMESLSAHGIAVPPEQRGLLEEQVAELKLEDKEGQSKIPSGGIDEFNKDPLQRRNGQRPKADMRQIIERTIEEAKKKISVENVKANRPLTFADVKECLEILKGAVNIVYPMGLPSYDPIRMEFENREEINPQANQVIDVTEATMWFANKEMKLDEKIEKFSGKNDKTKLIVKLSTKRSGQPCSESWLSPESQKRLAAQNFKRMEELKKLEQDGDDSYLNSAWADSQSLKRRFQGLSNITWKP